MKQVITELSSKQTDLPQLSNLLAELNLSPLMKSGGEKAHSASQIKFDPTSSQEIECSAVTISNITERFFVKIKIGDSNLNTLIDTGSSRSILSEKSFQLTKQLNKNFQTSNVKAIIFLNGNTQSTLGQIDLPCEIGTVTKEISFVVVKNFHYKCILGIDVIRIFKLLVDGESNTVRMIPNIESFAPVIDLIFLPENREGDEYSALKELTSEQIDLV